MEKCLRMLSFAFKEMEGFFVHLCYSMIKLRPSFIFAYLKGIWQGYKYARTYLKNIPNFVIQ